MIRFVVFHTGHESLVTYQPLMRAGRAALARTNPGAAYVVLTDKETAPHLDKDFEVEVLAPSGKPLMVQFIEAQIAYERKAVPGLVVLAATDCAPNKDFSTALHHNMAVTYRHRSKPDATRFVNNVAYIEDHDRAHWFLQRAHAILLKNLHSASMGIEYKDWWGDQAAWQEALGPVHTWEKTDMWEVKLAKPEGHWIHLYPCRTHNYFNKFGSAASAISEQAYILHFKGPRKLFMVEAVSRNILGGIPIT